MLGNNITIKIIEGKVLKVTRIKGELPEYERNFVKEFNNRKFNNKINRFRGFSGEFL